MKTPEEIKKGLEFCGSDNDCLPSLCPYYHECLFEDEYALQKDALTYILQLEAQVPKWISVEERLPKELQYVIAINRYDDDSFEPCIAYFSAREWFTGSFIGGCEITHWMPLPEPPEV